MAIKGGNFLLDNIEKIVLPIVGVFCLWLLVTRVIMATTVEYDGRNFSPGEIDTYIEKQTYPIIEHLKEEPVAREVHEAELGRYVSKVSHPVQVDSNLWPALPANTGEDDWDGRQYSIPEAPQISGAVAGRIRAMAYIPKQEVSRQIPYGNVETEPNDLDLVTVEAKLDVSALYTSFYDSFAGSAVKPDWRDPCLAKPIFAAVELERSQKQDDGSWSDWQEVPRLKVDDMSSMLEIIETVDDLPRGGLKVRLLQYNNLPVMKGVLQPRVYDIASAEEDWFPPSLHEQFTSLLKEQQAAERRAEMERQKEERDKGLDEARRTRREGRTTSSSRSSSRSSSGGGMMMEEEGSGSSGRERTPTRERVTRPQGPSRGRDNREQDREELRRRREEGKQTVAGVYTQMEEALIKSPSQLERSTEPLLFWSHDDTVEAGKTYRYRIRLGVFNPLAGTSKLKPEYESYKEKVIIWSDFAEAGTVEIPARLYFFAKDIREAANTVIVEVLRYSLGYWHSKEYAVRAGEVIGKIDEPEKPKEETAMPGGAFSGILIPEKVDFRTHVLMVDTVAIDDWTGGKNLRPQNYFNMYYSYDGSSIESMPVRQRFWSSQMQSVYNNIRGTMKSPKQPVRARGGEMMGPSPVYTPGPGFMPSGPGYKEEGIIEE